MQSQHTPAISLRALPVLFARAVAYATLLFVVLFSVVGVSALAAADSLAPVGGSGFTAFRLVDERPEFVAVDSIGARRLADRGFVVAPASKLTLLDARFISGVPANVPVLPAADPSGAVVAVLDTGVDPNHAWFANRLVPGQSFVGDPLDSSDGHGHGTHVAGIVSQTNPAARIMPIRVMDATGHGTDQQISAGIVWAVDNGASVINLSLGGPGRSFALDTAVEYARSRNVVVVAAAGNMGEKDSPVMYPAAYDQVVAVAAVDGAGVVAPFSNRGFYVDVAAPGVGIISALPGGGFGSMSGTSMSAPYVAGVVAQLRALRSDLDAASVIRHVESTSRDVGDPGRDDVYGWGVVDAPRIMAEAGSLAAAPVTVSAGPLKLTQSPRPGAVLLFSKKPLASVSVYVDGDLALKSDASSKQWRVPLLTATEIVITALDVEGRPYDMLAMDARPKPTPAPKVGLSRSPSVLKVTIKLPPVVGQVRLIATSGVGDAIDIVLPRRGKSTQVTYEIPTTRGLHWGVLVCLVSGSAEICSEYATSRR